MICEERSSRDTQGQSAHIGGRWHAYIVTAQLLTYIHTYVHTYIPYRLVVRRICFISAYPLLSAHFVWGSTLYVGMAQGVSFPLYIGIGAQLRTVYTYIIYNHTQVVACT